MMVLPTLCMVLCSLTVFVADCKKRKLFVHSKAKRSDSENFEEVRDRNRLFTSRDRIPGGSFINRIIDEPDEDPLYIGGTEDHKTYKKSVISQVLNQLVQEASLPENKFSEEKNIFLQDGKSETLGERQSRNSTVLNHTTTPFNGNITEQNLANGSASRTNTEWPYILGPHEEKMSSEEHVLNLFLQFLETYKMKQLNEKHITRLFNVRENSVPGSKPKDYQINEYVNNEIEICKLLKSQLCYNRTISHICFERCKVCSQWSEWSNCTAKCGNGTRYRRRDCVLGNQKSKLEEQAESCGSVECNIVCDEFNDWEPCSKPCDSGVTVRRRKCLHPDGITRANYDYKVCNMAPCENTTEKSKVTENHRSLTAFIGFESHKSDVTMVYDSSEEHNDASLINVLIYNGNNTCGFGGLFDKDSSVLAFNDDPFRNYAKSTYTICFWIYWHENKDNESSIFSLDSAKIGKAKLNISNEGRLYWLVRGIEKSETIKMSPAITLKSYLWYHICLVSDEDNKKKKFYVDGEAQEINETRLQEGFEDNVPVINIFGNSPSKGQQFYGVLDELFIFKIPLESGEVMEVANSCLPRNDGKCSPELDKFCSNCPGCSEAQNSSLPINAHGPNVTPLVS